MESRKATVVADEIAPAVLSKVNAQRYCGGAAVLDLLSEKHGLRPLIANRTRCYYSVGAIDHALRLLEHSVEPAETTSTTTTTT